MPTFYLVSLEDSSGYEETHYTPIALFDLEDDAHTFAALLESNGRSTEIIDLELDEQLPTLREGLLSFVVWVDDDGRTDASDAGIGPIEPWERSEYWKSYRATIKAHSKEEAMALAPVLLAEFLKKKDA